VVETVIRVPFASIERSKAADGEVWRANFFRIDRSATHGDEFSAWQPTMRNPPDFHVPAAFGELRFQR
jgi:alpha-galactosidase